jgi:hypothetical protein
VSRPRALIANIKRAPASGFGELCVGLPVRGGAAQHQQEHLVDARDVEVRWRLVANLEENGKLLRRDVGRDGVERELYRPTRS